MPAPESLLLFMAATLLLNFTPGPDMLYCIANSVGHGRRAGVVSAIGIGGGTLGHTLAATLGLSALLMSSALAYDLVRYIGAAYLVYLGFRTLASRSNSLPLASTSPGQRPAAASGTLFRRGVATNILNPKVALFFLAFLPQFVDPTRGPIVWQFLALGLLFTTSSTIVNAGVALAVGYAGDWLGRRPSVARAQRWFTGGVFLALGARIALGRG